MAFEDVGKYQYILLANYDAVYENALSFLTENVGVMPPWEDVSTSGKWSQVLRDNRKALLEVWERVEILGQTPWDKPLEYKDLLLFEFQTFFITEEKARLVFHLCSPDALVIASQLYQFLTALWTCEKLAGVDQQPTPTTEEVHLPPSPTSPANEDLPLWEQIPDYLWDRKLVEFLHKPEYAKFDWKRLAVRIRIEAGLKKLSGSRAASRAHELRELYGEHIAPERIPGPKPL